MIDGPKQSFHLKLTLRLTSDVEDECCRDTSDSPQKVPRCFMGFSSFYGLFVLANDHLDPTSVGFGLNTSHDNLCMKQ